MWRNTVFHFLNRTKEFHFKVMLKVPNFVFRFLGKKILEFCEVSKSYTSALYDKMFLWLNLCDILHSFFMHASISLLTKTELFNRP